MKRKKHSPPEKHTKVSQAGIHDPLKSAKGGKKLEIVLKCDSVGSQEVVNSMISATKDTQVEIGVIQSGVGSVTKSDLQMALTGSRLVLGFNVGVMPQINHLSQEQGVEVRLYNVIYRLVKALKDIASNLIPPEEEEIITGEAKVIALFKSRRRGIILGCEVSKGSLSLGKDFRVISAMGPIYTDKIESLHIEKDSVREAKEGQQVGLKISDFKSIKIGDLVECFKITRPDVKKIWQPRGGVFRYES